MRLKSNSITLLGTFFILFLAVSSCSTPDMLTWNETNKAEFMKGCTANIPESAMDPVAAKEMCHCMMEKVVAKYTLIESQNMDTEWVEKVSRECLGVE